MKFSLRLLLLIGLLLCVSPTAAQEEPYFPTTEWRTSTPEAQGMDSAEVAALFETFSADYYNLDSLLVVRHGVIVAEAYAPPFAQEDKHQLASASKSVTATLIGVLLQQGTLESLDLPLLGFFPEVTPQNLDANKEAITLRHMLTFTSGLDCNELTQANATTRALINSEDWRQFTLDLPVKFAPGRTFQYCNASTYLLSAVISELTGMSAAEYAAEHLFAPLGITDTAWTASPQGVSIGFAELYLNTRDLAKIGILYLNGGMWEGEQIIPADFAQAALSTQVEPGWPNTGYGYQWWTFLPNGAAIAVGFAGQYVLIDPAKDLVVVMTGAVNEASRFPLQYLPLAFTVMSLSAAEEALPEDAAAYDGLEAVLTRIENPVAAAPPLPPPIAEMLLGKIVYLGAPLPIEIPMGDRMETDPHVTANVMRWDFSDPDVAMLTLVLDTQREWQIPISLNGVYLVSEGPMGPLGARGEWRTADEFTFFIKYVGGEKLLRMDCRFFPGGIQVRTTEYAAGVAHFVPGVIVAPQ
ncbi:MAG: serine hydrolase [Anaerolineae bacterium]|nr:serine hydrolase [Anaerolineae bacterium]